ncbi:hypothetical protein E4U32_005342, partial [Claviceps aff. humidiphila group G2b]
MARTISCLATLLVARNAFVQAKPVPDERPLPTFDVRPIKVVTELEVSLATSFPAPTNLVFCHGETLSISQAALLHAGLWPLIKWTYGTYGTYGTSWTSRTCLHDNLCWRPRCWSRSLWCWCWRSR